ncbi:glutathione S-transferase family protein [Brevundimonas sp. KM4]|uniref:glutathione S-transferase family protein n=1 Tax=Brevundimonas sp. KM4 TaxID=1628191 RepID=UPI0005F766ED|nr:glutathione S-transferase family protein [Brevundimonas sp. KM4]KJV43212.1 glutathione S-transferase [Brevundimonas sp. KM4]
MELVIGDKAYSTWSLRPWLVLKHCDADFDEIVVPLNQPDTDQRIREHSPSGLVPVLKVEGEVIWDSMAIAVWAAERYPEARLWPSDAHARWLARSAACEMHGGFTALRTACSTGPDHWMVGPSRAPAPDHPGLAKDLRRIVELWRSLRDRFGAGGPYLFGDWSVPDAFFTPVAARIRHFQLDLSAHGDDGTARAYAETLLAHPHFLEWEADALGLTHDNHPG